MAIGWAALSHILPLYSLYALLFTHAGLSDAKISTLFALWSAVGIVAEVPSGALADRFSRRGALVAAGLLQAAGFTLWITLPGFPAFAAGFVLWGLGGALVSGALEALLYDGLAAVGAEEHYARVFGKVRAAELIVQPPAAVAATVLFSLGGYTLAGWVSIACCLAAAALATRLPEPAAHPPQDLTGPASHMSQPAGGQPTLDRPELGSPVPQPVGGRPAEDRPALAVGLPEPVGVEPGEECAVEESYLATLRAGLAEVATRPGVRAAVIAVAALTAMDALEEYFPLIARDWGVPTALNPVAVLVIPVAGAAGAALAGMARRWRSGAITALFGAAVLALGVAAIVRHPAGLVLVALFYGLYQLVLVVLDARLQDRIDGTARATVTSVAALGTELVTFAVYAAWTLGGLMLVTVLLALVTATLPRLLHVAARRTSPDERTPDTAGIP